MINLIMEIRHFRDYTMGSPCFKLLGMSQYLTRDSSVSVDAKVEVLLDEEWNSTGDTLLIKTETKSNELKPSDKNTGGGLIAGRIYDTYGHSVGKGLTVMLATNKSLKESSLPHFRKSCSHCDNEPVFECKCPSMATNIAHKINKRLGEAIPSYTVYINNKGEFRFSKLQADEYILWVKSDNFALIVEADILLGEDQEVFIKLEALPAISISIRVIEIGKLPIEEALVTLVDSKLGVFYEAISDAKGYAKINGLHRERDYYLSITAENYFSFGKPNLVPKDGQEFTLRSGSIIKGVVRLNGNTIKDAMITLGGGKKKTFTNDSGEFAFGGLWKGEHRLYVNYKEFCSESRYVSIGESETKDIQVDLIRGAYIKAYVKDEDNKPLEGIRVLFKQGYYQEGITVISNKDGLAEMAGLVTDKSVILDVNTEGYMECSKWIHIETGEEQVVTLILRKGPQVLVNIKDAFGENIVNASVLFNATAKTQLKLKDTIIIDRITDNNGNARFENVAAGTYNIIVDSKKYGRLSSEFVLEQSNLKISLQYVDGVGMRGIVINDQGDPISNAQISLDRANLSFLQQFQFLNTQQTVTDKKGEFYFKNLANGEWKVRVSKDNLVPKSTLFTIEDESPDIELKIMLESGGKITGVVVDWKKEPIKDIKLMLIPTLTEFDFANFRDSISINMLTESDENGEFEFTGLEDRNYQIILLDKIKSELLENIKKLLKADSYKLGDHVVIRIGGDSKLTGTVSFEDGANPQKILVSFGGVRTVISGSNPDFLFDKLESGKKYLIVKVDGYVTNEQTVEIPESDEIRVDVNMKNGCTMKGLIIDDETEKPISNATLKVIYPEQFGSFIALSEQLQTTFSTDKTGSFSINGLATGSYQLKVSVKGYGSMLYEPIQIDNSCYHNAVKIRLKKGVSFAGRFIQGNEGIANLRLSVCDVNSSPLGCMHSTGIILTDKQGNFVLDSVQPGEIILSASKQISKSMLNIDTMIFTLEIPDTDSDSNEFSLYEDNKQLIFHFDPQDTKRIIYLVEAHISITSGEKWTEANDIFYNEKTRIIDGGVRTMHFKNLSKGNKTIMIFNWEETFLDLNALLEPIPELVKHVTITEEDVIEINIQKEVSGRQED